MLNEKMHSSGEWCGLQASCMYLHCIEYRKAFEFLEFWGAYINWRNVGYWYAHFLIDYCFMDFLWYEYCYWTVGQFVTSYICCLVQFFRDNYGDNYTPRFYNGWTPAVSAPVDKIDRSRMEDALMNHERQIRDRDMEDRARREVRKITNVIRKLWELYTCSWCRF